MGLWPKPIFVTRCVIDVFCADHATPLSAGSCLVLNAIRAMAADAADEVSTSFIPQ